MESKKNINNMNLAGDIRKEMKEIQKMQSTMPYYLTVVTNTCSGFRTIFCC